MPRHVTESRTTAIIVEGIPCRNGKIVECERPGMRRTRDDDDIAEREDRRVLAPGVELGEGVPAEREHDAVRRSNLGAKRPQGVDGVGRPVALDLDGPCAQAGVPRNSAPDHAIPNPGPFDRL